MTAVGGVYFNVMMNFDEDIYLYIYHSRPNRVNIVLLTLPLIHHRRAQTPYAVPKGQPHGSIQIILNETVLSGVFHNFFL